MTTWTVLGAFLHGLTFFVLSLVIAFLQYRSHRILLARRLTWLGIFAFCESLVAWNDLLAPLLERTSLFPSVLRTGILLCGYAYLLAFGLQTFLPRQTPPARIDRLVLILQATWVVPYVAAMAFTLPHVETTAHISEVIARYLLAFPGGLLTGIGIRRQSYETLEKEWRLRIRPYLRLSEVTAAAFGLFNLIMVPPAPFPPANYVNTTLLPCPADLIWAMVGLLWAVGLMLTLTKMQTRIEEWIENVEHIQALSSDRERIGRELHDGIIQSIYASGLMLESVQHILPTEPEKAQAQLSRILENLNQTIQDIRRYIFDLRSDMPDDDLEPGLRRLMRDFHINTLLETDVQISGEPSHIITMERRRHIFQIVREAITNTSRHAHARVVKLSLIYAPETLDLTISDDGVGMETLVLGKGYGLRNIRERARLLDGKLKIESAPGEGVKLHLTIPY